MYLHSNTSLDPAPSPSRVEHCGASHPDALPSSRPHWARYLLAHSYIFCLVAHSCNICRLSSSSCHVLWRTRLSLRSSGVSCSSDALPGARSAAVRMNRLIPTVDADVRLAVINCSAAKQASEEVCRDVPRCLRPAHAHVANLSDMTYNQHSTYREFPDDEVRSQAARIAH
jgi:hypothetical protein